MVSHRGAIGSSPMAKGWNGPAPRGAVFNCRAGRKDEYADEILIGLDRTLQGEEGQQTVRGTVCPTTAHGGHSHLTKPVRKGEDAIRGAAPDHRRAVRQDLFRPLVAEFLAWRAAQAARISRKGDLGEAPACMLRRENGFRFFGACAAPLAPRSPSILENGRVDLDANLVENAIGSPAIHRKRRALCWR